MPEARGPACISKSLAAEPRADTNACAEVPNSSAGQGAVAAGASPAVDLAEHLRIEAELRSMAAFPEENPNPVLRADGHGQILYANPAARKMLSAGCPDGELLLPHPLREAVICVLAQHRPVDVEFESASEHVFLFAVALSRTEGWVNLYGRDITERRRMEESLRASREDLNRAQAVARVGSWRLNVQSNELLWSDEAWRIFGLPRSERLGYETFLGTVHPDDRDYVDQQWQAALRGKPYDIEHRILVDGTVKWVRERAELEFDEHGRLQGGFGTTQDITERKQAEAELTAAKLAAEAASAAKSRFLANMSHELRTPMNAILGMIDVALPKAVNPIVRDCLQTARESADLLLTLLNDLLDTAKIESGRLELESAPFSLRQMLDHTTRVLSVRAAEKSLAFSCHVDPHVPDALLGDRVRLQQVLLNLAGNAIKFTEQGEVDIRVSALIEDGDAVLDFAVRDTGIGIPPGGLERLFMPFTQADTSTSRRFGGTGLGLYIARNLVETMGGRIWSESEAGQGSTFYFRVRLPVSDEVSEFAPPAEIPQPAQRLTVLLAEDNPANQKLATYVLRERGHRVDVACDGAEALKLARQNHYDAMLIDVQMPRMNGWEATAAIRRGEVGPHRVPIIAMTAHAMKEDRDRCLAAGMDGYLSKPFDAQELIRTVETLATRPSRVPPLAAGGGEASRCESLTVFNPDEALAKCFHNETMLRDMARCFFPESERVLPQLYSAAAGGDWAEVGHLAHRLKGTIVHLGAASAREAVLEVERLSRSASPAAPQLQAAIHALERECTELRRALAEQVLLPE